MLRFIAVAIALLPATTAAQPPRIGETYELKMVREMAEKDSAGGESSSYDRDVLIERVIAVRADGLELEYDLPKDSQDRSSNWQFPVRIFKPLSGPPQLLNRAELEVNLDRWLKDAKWTRDICGHWIFTWNAFQIDCDPENAVKIVAEFDLTSVDARDGAPYSDPAASASVTLKASTGHNGTVFVADLTVDPNVVHREDAKSDVVVGEIMRKPVTLEAALAERSKEAVSGTIRVTFDTDTDGSVIRRTRLMKLEIKKPNGQSETRTVTQTLERERISEH